MPIRFYCPLGHRLVVPDERAGKKGRCPQCHQKVYVPVAEPRSGSQPRQPPAGQAIELDPAGEVPVILDAPRATGPRDAVPRGGQHQPAAAAARKASAAAEPVDSKDPLALAMDEITSMQIGKPIVYMPIADEQPSHSGSVSNWLPPKTPKVETSAVAAPEPPPAVASPPLAPVASPGAKSPAANVPPVASAPVAAIRTAAPVRGWIRSAEPDEMTRVFRPDETRLQMMYLLGGALMLVALLSSWPALTHFRRHDAAPWVAAVLLMSVANLVYVVWLLSLADWSTLRVGMALCAVCAATYACGLAIVMGTPASGSIALGLDEVRADAGSWCALQMGLLGGVCYGFGRQASSWRDEARGDW
ncbi:MAG TPA: hypothetical protein VHV55_25765 [Pirellulales bacterium]|jgi:hypothetical protein|nr:hypothetical protein [Pirellulales bacterium]